MAMTFKTQLIPFSNLSDTYTLGTSATGWKIFGNLTGTASNVPLAGVASATNLQAIEALEGTSGLLKKTAQNTWTLDNSSYITKPNSSTAGNVIYYADDQGNYSSNNSLSWDSTNNILNAPKLNGYIIAGQRSGSTLGIAATVEGIKNTSSNTASHAEGTQTTASGGYSHAEGYGTKASGFAAHAEGKSVIASATSSHAEGGSTNALGLYSHAEGWKTTAKTRSQHIFGEYNIPENTTSTDTTAATNRGVYVEIVGNGESGNLSNARTLDWNGNEWLAGKLTISTTPTEAMDVVNKSYADNLIATNDAMVFKGIVNLSVNTLPATHEVGWTYRVAEAGTYAGQACEIGDLIICTADGTTSSNADWMVAQTNLDGAVIGPASSTINHIAVFTGATGKAIKDSGFTIAKSVPADAVFNYSVSESGTGNVVTSVTASNGIINVTKGNISIDGYLPLTGGTLTGALTVSNGTATTSIQASGYISGEKVYGAVWNDYAEFRTVSMPVRPGQCVREIGDDTLVSSQERLERGCEIVSDTFGFAIGKTDNANTPIAVCGRVLAYPYESREEFAAHIGWPVCSGPQGTVSIMSKEEEEKYPSRIVGTISAVPNYEEWGNGKIKVDGRVWIKIK